MCNILMHILHTLFIDSVYSYHTLYMWLNDDRLPKKPLVKLNVIAVGVQVIATHSGARSYSLTCLATTYATIDSLTAKTETLTRVCSGLYV